MWVVNGPKWGPKWKKEEMEEEEEEDAVQSKWVRPTGGYWRGLPGLRLSGAPSKGAAGTPQAYKGLVTEVHRVWRDVERGQKSYSWKLLAIWNSIDEVAKMLALGNPEELRSVQREEGG